MAATMKTTSAFNAAVKWAARASAPEGLRLHLEPGFEVPLDGTAEALERQTAETHTKTGTASRVTAFPVRVTLERVGSDGSAEAVGRSAVVASRDGERDRPDGLTSAPGVGVCAVPQGIDPRDKAAGLEYRRVETAAALREWLDAWLDEEAASL